MDDNLIKTECYICMESCDEESPCSCATTVHNECLQKFLNISGNEACTICLDDFSIEPIKKTHGEKYVLHFIFVGGFVFLVVYISWLVLTIK